MPNWTPELEQEIFDLFAKVREHPLFVAGTIFIEGGDTKDDLTDQQRRDLRRIDDALAETGNEIICDLGLASGDDD